MGEVVESRELSLRRLEKLMTDWETKTGHRASDMLRLKRLYDALWPDIPPDLKARAGDRTDLFRALLRQAKEKGMFD